MIDKIFNGEKHLTDQRLMLFDLKKPASTMIAFWGLTTFTDKLQDLYIQFKDGKCFMYREISEQDAKDIVSAESVGKFWHARIKAVYEGNRLDDNMILKEPNEIALAKDNIFDGRKIFAKKGEKVEIIGRGAESITIQNTSGARLPVDKSELLYKYQ